MKVPDKEIIGKIQKLKQETEAVLHSSQAVNIHTAVQHLEVHHVQVPTWSTVD
jgi:hypothetical protein